MSRHRRHPHQLCLRHPRATECAHRRGLTTNAQTPNIAVTGVHIAENSSAVNAEGAAVNRSSVAQQELVVFAIDLCAGKMLAAERAVLPNASANSSTQFQVVFIGNPKGASLQVSAPPTTLG
jgi:hypothetical protein